MLGPLESPRLPQGSTGALSARGACNYTQLPSRRRELPTTSKQFSPHLLDKQSPSLSLGGSAPGVATRCCPGGLSSSVPTVPLSAPACAHTCSNGLSCLHRQAILVGVLPAKQQPEEGAAAALLPTAQEQQRGHSLQETL